MGAFAATGSKQYTPHPQLSFFWDPLLQKIQAKAGVIRAFSDFKAFLYILIGGFS